MCGARLQTPALLQVLFPPSVRRMCKNTPERSHLMDLSHPVQQLASKFDTYPLFTPDAATPSASFTLEGY